MVERLSYRDFKEDLLIALAVCAKADTSKSISLSTARERIVGSFNDSWLSSAAKEMADQGLLNGMTFLSGDGSYTLTGSGLDRAEELANNRATDLYELIDEAEKGEPLFLSDEHGNRLTDEKGNRIIAGYTGPLLEADGGDSPAEVIVKIDHLSEAFKELDKELQATIRDLRGNNQLMAEGGPEVGQRLAELEAGKALIQADQADANKVLSILLKALRWFATKVGEAAVKKGIDELIIIIIRQFSSGGSGS